MAYDCSWIVPRLRNPGFLWLLASSLLLAAVGLSVKIFMVLFSRMTVFNQESLRRATRGRAPGVPLITVANHHSGFDDPGIWGVRRCVLARRGRMRWTLIAQDTVFTRAANALFFTLCKCVPVVRGGGVCQSAMDFCMERLRRGEWVHIFPEGAVNEKKQHVRFKWGVGRLVADCPTPPLVLPIWHEGMDSIFPNKPPRRLTCRKPVFISIGEPIQIHSLLNRLRLNNTSEEDSWRLISEHIQDEMMRLRDKTHALIKRSVGPHAFGLLDNRTDVLVKAPPLVISFSIETETSKHADKKEPVEQVFHTHSTWRSTIVASTDSAATVPRNAMTFTI